MSQQPDQYYIDCVLAGDHQAYGMLINRYKHMVFTLAIKIVRNREDAEEVAQDVFFKAYKALHSYRGSARFSTWLYKIAYYRSLDYLKKNRSALQTVTIDSMPSHTSFGTALSADDPESSDQFVRKAIDQLAQDDQIILILHYYEEMALNDIAIILGISANAVKTRMFRSRQRLAGMLKELGIEKKHTYEKAK